MKAEYIIGADIVEEVEVKVGYMGVLADRILYSNRSRYSRGDRGEGGIHGCLGGQDRVEISRSLPISTRSYRIIPGLYRILPKKS